MIKDSNANAGNRATVFKRAMTRLAVLLGISQIALILLSWLIVAAAPESMVHSLLSSEGIRWFFAHFTDNLLTPLLLWMLLFGMAAGAMHESRLWQSLLTLLRFGKPHESLSFRQRFALQMVALELIIIIVVMCLLTLMPHAVLLSVTGDLFPSSFSASIIPTICFTMCLCAVTYGYLSGSQRTLSGIAEMLTAGIGRMGPLWLVYILGTQLFFSLQFVFPTLN